MQLELDPYPYAVFMHYDTIAAWWKARGDTCLPEDVLPATGAVVTRDGEPIAACYLWLTNAYAAYIAFPVTAPGLSPRVALRAVEMAVDGAIACARKEGCKMIWGAAENRGVDRIFQRKGLVRTSPPLHNYFMLLDPSISSDMLVGDEPKGDQ